MLLELPSNWLEETKLFSGLRDDEASAIQNACRDVTGISGTEWESLTASQYEMSYGRWLGCKVPETVRAVMTALRLVHRLRGQGAFEDCLLPFLTR